MPKKDRQQTFHSLQKFLKGFFYIIHFIRFSYNLCHSLKSLKQGGESGLETLSHPKNTLFHYLTPKYDQQRILRTESSYPIFIITLVTVKKRKKGFFGCLSHFHHEKAKSMGEMLIQFCQIDSQNPSFYNTEQTDQNYFHIYLLIINSNHSMENSVNNQIRHNSPIEKNRVAEFNLVCLF